MIVFNASEGNFNLASGTVKPGQSGEATYEECKVLFSSNKAVVEEPEEIKAEAKPAPVKPTAKTVAK